jgi:hypothetical protein
LFTKFQKENFIFLSFVVTKVNVNVKGKVKQASYRPGVAQRIPGSKGSQIS